MELYEARRQRALQLHALKGWRMDTNVACYLRQKPWRTKKRILRRLRCQTAHGHASQLERRLGEHLAGRRFIAYYKAFEHWQQLFQARKMEEHLCGQNLIYYHHRKKQLLLRCWQLGGARRILHRLQGLRLRKRILASWRQHCLVSTQARSRRLVGRVLARWRRSYREAIVRDLLAQADRRRLRLALLHWRQQAGAQQRSHRKSIEFIGQSNVRYMLQKWRTEVALRQALCAHHHRQYHLYGGSEYPRHVLAETYSSARSRSRRATLTQSLHSLPSTGPLSRSEFIV